MPITTVTTIPMELKKKEHDSLYQYQPFEMETAHDYRSGGLLAVDVDSELDNLRYEVIRKLGHGELSTVYLALDTKTRQWVALKAFNARTSKKMEKNDNFEQVVERANKCDHVMHELTRFKEKSLNGEHTVQVFEVMGPSISVLWNCMSNDAVKKKMTQLRSPMTKKLAKQALMGLKELHDAGVVHGNMDMTNWLLELDSLEEVRRKKLDQDFEEPESFIENVKQKGAPERIMADQPLFKFVKMDGGLHMKLGGMYSSFVENGSPSDGKHPNLHLRTPEAILNPSQVNKSIDVWAMACVMFEMLTGSKLFEFTRTKSKEIDDQHLIEMNNVIGALPEKLTANWKPSNAYAKCIGSHGHITPPQDIKPKPILEAHFDNMKPATIDDNEASQIKSLLRSMLQYEPSKRPSVDEVLAHPWLAA